MVIEFEIHHLTSAHQLLDECAQCILGVVCIQQVAYKTVCKHCIHKTIVIK
jgi:hypothetical protein